MTIDFDLSTVLFFAIIYFALVVFLRFYKKKSMTFIFFFTLSFVYLVTVLKYTQFPLQFDKSIENLQRNLWHNINLIPLLTLQARDLRTSVLNILLTVPFGFGLPFATHWHARRILLAGVLLSASLELLQLITALIAGFTFRIVDINDVIFNSLGVAVGYALFIGLFYLSSKKFQKFLFAHSQHS